MERYITGVLTGGGIVCPSGICANLFKREGGVGGCTYAYTPPATGTLEPLLYWLPIIVALTTDYKMALVFNEVITTELLQLLKLSSRSTQ